jgi:ATP-binding cassette, subfamily B, bacterial HlyB/CyaB
MRRWVGGQLSVSQQQEGAQGDADPAQLCHALGWPYSHAPNSQDFLVAAKHLGLKATLTRSTPERLTLTPLPALALIRDEAGTVHTVVLAQCDGQRVLFQDPSGAIQGGRAVIEPLEVFARQWTGKLILVTANASRSPEPCSPTRAS